MKAIALIASLLTVLAAGAGVVLELPFDRATPEVRGKAAVVAEGDGKALRVDSETTNTVGIDLPAEPLAGRRVTLSCEVKREIPEILKRWQGGKLMLTYRDAAGKGHFPGHLMPVGNFGWERLTVTADLPLEVKSPKIILGIQHGRGSIFYRNLKVETGDVILDLGPVANMGLRDGAARDGKGGWTDEGKNNDAANFQFKQEEFAGIPFRVTDPAKNDGKAVITFAGAKFPAGVSEAVFDLRPGKISGKWLYLLHTLTQCPKGTVFSDLEAVGKNGKRVRFELEAGRDAANWWGPARKPNAVPASVWNNGSTLVGVYASRFQLPPELGELAELRLNGRNSAGTWVVCAITLSDREYPLADVAAKALVIEAGERWKVLPVPKEAGIRPGSALDLRSLFPPAAIDALGRIQVDADGHFCAEKRPGERIRFLSEAQTGDPFHGRSAYKVLPEYDTKERIEAYADELQKRGYNMVRFHHIDSVLMHRRKTDLDFGPETLEKYDYLMHCLRQRGIYYQLDVMTSRLNYAAGNPWKGAAKPDPRDFKLEIFFKPEVRRIWAEGMRKVFQRRNPYTGLRLIDDPALVMVVCCNEQEFAFFSDNDFTIAQPAFKAFLRRRYPSVEELSKAWGVKLATFDDAAFTGDEIGQGSAKGRDIARFIAAMETELFSFYRTTLRDAGFKGLIANWNMGKSFHAMSVRDDHDYVALNGYHNHPHGSTIDPCSSVGASARLLRSFAGSHRYGRPLVVTEHLHTYWNPYRYEGGMVTGAYAALQGFDALTAFAHSVTTHPEAKLAVPFSVRFDPIAAASEFQTALLFRRGDVTPARQQFRLFFDREAVYDSGSSGDGLDTEESMLALVGAIRTEVGKPEKLKPNEIPLPAYGGSRISAILTGGVGALQSEDSAGGKHFSFDREIAELKAKKQLPADNRSSFKDGVFESATGELLLEKANNRLTVNTPRFRGVTGEAGTKAELPGFRAELGRTRGALAAASVDPAAETLEKSDRIVIFFVTNLLNSGSSFEDDTFRVRTNVGKLPWLLETGSFKLTLDHQAPDGLKAYALGLDGGRIAELPLRKTATAVTLDVDTATISNGPALYFELSADKQ